MELENLTIRKTFAGLTIDENINDYLLAFVKKHKLKSLSGLVNEILKDWIRQQGSF